MTMLRSATESARRWRRAARIDVLVNNAGIGVHGTVEELPLAEFRHAMETNFFGALRCIQAVVPAMRERRQRLHRQCDQRGGTHAPSPRKRLTRRRSGRWKRPARRWRRK